MISLSPWLLVAIALAVIALGVVSAFAITRARRLDRLHQRILASRDSLSRLLLRRASEADLLSRSAGLEGSGLADAARAYIQDGETNSRPMASIDGLRRSAKVIVLRSRRAWNVHPPCLARSVRLLPPMCGHALRQMLRLARAWKRWMRRATASSSHATCITWTSREYALCVPHGW